MGIALLTDAWILGEPAVAQDASATPGTIRGVVMSVETAEYLDYANVLIKDTQRGTMSLGRGEFYFQGLPPGAYTIEVLYLGYAPMQQTVVLEAGQTQSLVFDLVTVIVDVIPPFDVEAAAIMVEIEDTTTRWKVDTEELMTQAIDNITEAVARHPGVVMRDGELYIRGGRSGEVSVRLDGIAIDNPLDNGSLEVSNLALASVNTVTGGMDAKYGSALSGVVDMVTRTGGDEFDGRLRYTTDDFGRMDRTYTNYDRLEYGFGGPTPLDGLTYFFAGDMTFSDGELYTAALRPEYKVRLGDLTLLKFRRRQFNSAKGSTKWAYEFSEGKVLTAEYSYANSLNEAYSPNWSVSGYARRIIYLPQMDSSAPGLDADTFLYTGRTIPVYYGPWYETMMQTARPVTVLDSRNSSTIRQIVPVLRVRSAADNAIYTVAAQPLLDGFRYPYSVFSTTQEDSSYTWFNSANRAGQFKNIGQIGKLVWRHNLSNETFYTVKLGLVSFDQRNDVAGKRPWEYNHGGIWSPDLFYGQYGAYQQAGDYYTDPLNPLYVTTSDNPFYFEQYTRSYTAQVSLVSQRWPGHHLDAGAQVVYNDLESYALGAPARERRNRFTGEYSLGGGSNLFHTYNPEASWYVQDRWEHEGMVVNYGLRWDMFSPGSAADIRLRSNDVDRNVTKYKTQFSPRIGFAFPITERDGFFFHYGRFIQFPGRDALFASQDPIGNGGQLGNPDLQSESTVQYSAGIKHQFTHHLAGQFSLYSKDIYDLLATVGITNDATGNTVYRYINRAYASARGIEFSLQRRAYENYSFDLGYTLSYADGVASSQQFGSNPNGLEYLPNQELPLNWDVRHKFDLQLRLFEPEKWSTGLTFTYQSGFPWTPHDRNVRRQDPLLENSERFPATFSLNMQGDRFINFYGQQLNLFFQARNLLNQDMVAGRGTPFITPAMNNADITVTDYLTETGKLGGAYLMDADGDNNDEFIPINDPRVFQPHRVFRVGFGVQF